MRDSRATLSLPSPEPGRRHHEGHSQAITPLSPANVLRDVVFPALEKAEIEWLGYHAFRRGLATNLRALGVDDLTIMEILRHSDVSVTRQNYIKRVSEKSVEAMDRLEAELRKPVASVTVKGKV